MIGKAAVLCVIAAEGLAIYLFAAWAAVTFEDGEHAVSGVTLVALTLAAFGLPRFLGNLDLPVRARWLAAAAITWVVLYGALRIEFGGDLALWDFGWVGDFLRSPSDTTRAHSDAVAGVIVVLVAWIWGLVRSEADIDLELVPKMLGGAFAAVTLAAILASSASAAGEVGRAAGAFYAVAIVALALSQSARSGATIGTLRTGGVTAILLAGTLGAVLLCIVVFGLLWGPLAPPAGRALGAVLEVVLLIVFTPPAWVLAQVLELIFGSGGSAQEVVDAARDTSGEAAEPGGSDQSTAERVVVFAARALFLIIVVGVAAGLIRLVMRIRRRGQETIAGGVATSRAGGSLFDDGRSLFGRFRRAPQPSSAVNDDAVRLYVAVLDEARRRGHERVPGATPEEFAPELVQTFNTAVTDEITGAFEQARYAGRRPDATSVRDLERRWRESTR